MALSQLSTRFSLDERLPRMILFALYFVSVTLGEAELLASVCFHYDSGWMTFETALFAVFFAISVVLFVCLWGQANKKEQTLFALVAWPILVGFALFMMPFAVPDEFTHINRVFDNRSVDILTTPAQLLDAYEWIGSYSILEGFLMTPFDYSLTKETDFSAAAYHEINYLPASIAVSVGTFFGINGYVLIFVGRIVNAALYLAAGYWMIGKLPVGKKLALVFLLNPMLLQQEASCSADVLCNIAILGFIVQLIAMRLRKDGPLPKREWLILFVFVALVALCKYIYLPLLLSAIVLYPKIESKAIRRALPFIIVAAMVAAVAFVVFRGYGDSLETLVSNFSVAGFFGVLGATIVEEGSTIAWQLAGGNLGWPYMNYTDTPATVRVPFCWILFYVVLAAAVLSGGDKRVAFKRWDRAAFAAVALLGSLLIYAAMWRGADCGAVTWMQGRYFIPPLFLLLFAMLPSKETRFARIPTWAFAVAMIVINAVSLLFVIRWFW